MYRSQKTRKRHISMILPRRHIHTRNKMIKLSRPPFMSTVVYDKMVPEEKRQTNNISYNHRIPHKKTRRNSNLMPQIQIPIAYSARFRRNRTIKNAHTPTRKRYTRSRPSHMTTQKTHRNLSSMLETFNNTTGCRSCRGAM